MARAEDGHIEGGAKGGIGGLSEDCGWKDELDEGLKAHFEGIRVDCVRVRELGKKIQGEFNICKS